MKKTILFSIITVSLFTGFVSADNGWGVRQISSGLKQCHDHIRISGNNAVWLEADYLNWQVMFWNGVTSQQISTGQNRCQESVQISGDNVAWTEETSPDSGIWKVMYWNGSTPQQISSGINTPSDVKISNGNVIWREAGISDYQIMFWDGVTAQQISNGLGPSQDAHISGENVVWSQQAYVNAPQQIMFWDGATTQQLSNGLCEHPQISGTNVVWSVRINSAWQVMFWNGGTPIQVSTSENTCEYPQISGESVVWRESIPDSGIWKVMYWNGGTPQQISSGENTCSDVKISNGNVVWHETTDSGWQIMLWDGTTTKNLARNLSLVDKVGFSGDSVVWRRQTSYGNLLYYYDGNTTAKVAGAQNMVSFGISGTNILFSSTSFSDSYDLQIYLVQPGGWINAESIEVGQVKTGSTTGTSVGYDFTQQWGYNDTVDVWYIFTAPADDDYIIGTIGSDFDTTLAVFDNDHNEIEFNDNYNCKQSKLTLRAATGVKYFIRIAGYNGQTGNYQLSIINDGPEPLMSDINTDGSVNMLDLGILASEWLSGT